VSVSARPPPGAGHDRALRATRRKADMNKREFERRAEFRYRLRSFLRASEELCRAEGITPLQYQMLLQVKGFPGRPWALVGELAERLHAPQHGVAALVTRAEKAGLVERIQGTADRRHRQVHLTAQGDRVIQRLAAAHDRELRPLSEVIRSVLKA
jgi:DNA-binding MarR family transcriptional regulator